MSKKVLFVVGSLREKSFNKTVAEYISKKLEEKGIETSFLDYSKLPFINIFFLFYCVNKFLIIF